MLQLDGAALFWDCHDIPFRSRPIRRISYDRKGGILLGWMQLLTPDRCFSSFADVTPSFLRENGIAALACDIDNTLVTYDDAVPTPTVLAWLEMLHAAGISVGFVSNNHIQRVMQFCRELSMPFFVAPDAKKPSCAALRRFLKQTGYPAAQVAVLGDQIFTDVLMGKRLGCRAFLVPPIKDRTDWFHRLKRRGEQPFLHRYCRQMCRRGMLSPGDSPFAPVRSNEET